MEIALQRAREDGANELASRIRRALGEHGEEAQLTAVIRGLVSVARNEPLTFFFDSHGGLWRSYQLNDHDMPENATAFGPDGAAVRVLATEIGLNAQPGEAAFSAADRAGRLAWVDGWYWLTAAPA
jgi:hypothetical protein